MVTRIECLVQQRVLRRQLLLLLVHHSIYTQIAVLRFVSDHVTLCWMLARTRHAAAALTPLAIPTFR
jgi:hypothetical protein